MVLIQAESDRVTRVNYISETISDDAFNVEVVRIENFDDSVGQPGLLTFTWTAEDGPIGKYDISIAHFDEEDGESLLRLKVNGKKVDEYSLDEQFSTNVDVFEPVRENYVPLTGGNKSGTLTAENNPNPIFKSVDLAPEDIIQISVEATTNRMPSEGSYELGRIDAIKITPAEEIIPSLDLFWHNPNPKSGKVGVWTLNEEGTSLETAAFITDQSGQDVLVPNDPFKARGVIDLVDGIRKPLWRDPHTGGVGFWNMEGSEYQNAITTQAPAGQPGSNLDWEIRGTGDVNGGGAEEIFWYNKSSGEIAVWEIDENQFKNATFITNTNGDNMIISPKDPWRLVAAGDMDNDGDADAIWENMNTRKFAYWKLDGTVYQESVLIESRAADGPWEFRGAYDANKDGTDDFFFRNSLSGQNGIWMIENNSLDDIVVITPVEDTNFSFYV
ncbi:MAG: hypothetical protein F6J94_19475 [Moorea sp. SIO1F2]|uniref:FG-GAP repeat domain-containing protein n=1 Tax=Moorena sp. SIO1F2 TaxID=2607819 RepID=UPI0013B7F58C|nr:VCBS repeat-containing protein [Moorena sp. SIO1F2]NET84019.1 hypothetical protein [Moorena sp. SIO1F2]